MANATKNTRTTRNKPSHSGHESVLNFAQRTDKRITLMLVNGTCAYGKVKSFDRFTISIIQDGQDHPTIYFKSAIVGFYCTDVHAQEE